MNEVENEDLVLTLEAAVDKFGEESVPYAFELCQILAASFSKCIVEADALFYNPTLTLSILQKLGVAIEIFNLWFHMLQKVKKSGVLANFTRNCNKKVCCLGMILILALSAGQLPAKALGRIFRATLDLLVAYKNQIAEGLKDEASWVVTSHSTSDSQTSILEVKN